MTAPADRPAARLTEDQLSVIERDHARVAAGVPSIWPDAVALAYIPVLLAEVRHLRGLLAPLVEKVPVAYDCMDAEECAYCGGDMDSFARKWGRTPVPTHAPDCPWLLAHAALATGGPRAALAPAKES